MTKLFRPKIDTPKLAQAPAPISDTKTPRQELGADNETTTANRRRRGRNSLRIDPQLGGAGVSAGSSGLNIPMK